MCRYMRKGYERKRRVKGVGTTEAIEKKRWMHRRVKERVTGPRE